MTDLNATCRFSAILARRATQLFHPAPWLLRDLPRLCNGYMTLCSLSRRSFEQMFRADLTRTRRARFSCEFALCVRAHVFAEGRGLKAHGTYSRFHLGTHLPREQECYARRIVLT